LAVGLAAKTTTDKVPLWTMVLAAYTNDVLKLGFRVAGLETNSEIIAKFNGRVISSIPANIPWSHGFFMSAVWSIIAGGIAYLVFRDRRTASTIGLVVISHWLLDFIVHPAELPLLFKDSPMVGLGLWSTPQGFVASILLEAGMLAGGIALYWFYLKREQFR
jgi:hypothetical protein